MERETFATRIGFLLMTAGCAIGLGNIWRFPYITGQNGGGWFFLMYLIFLAILGFPVMVMELSIGRAGQANLAGAMRKLQNRGSAFRWEIPGKIAFLGNLLLLMFYSVITGWLLSYTFDYAAGVFRPGMAHDAYFGMFLADWPRMLLSTAISILMTVIVCAMGVRSGVERSIKWMMGGLFLLMLILAVKALSLKGAAEGLRFFLEPNLEHLKTSGVANAVHDAMSQAFFTLSLGIGSIAICGSYTGRDRSLPGETTVIILLDTLVAVLAGFIIFPACFSAGVKPDSGPSLIFVTLPKVFEQMTGGRWWGFLFFLFMSTAALSTLIAVAENLIAFAMEEFHFSRTRASAAFGAVMMILSAPCALGFNLWKSFQPFGKGSCVLDLEDFLVSDNLLPLGAVMIVLFCTRSSGWGYDRFLTEAETGKGMRFPRKVRFYVSYVLPLMILLLWGTGIWAKIQKLF